MKKYIILIVLFLLPISVYLFFATGVNNFVKLPVVSEDVKELSMFKSVDGTNLQLEDKITVLLFFGKDSQSKKANAFNLAHKIYKKNYQFEEFQFVTLITDTELETITKLKEELSEIENPKNWKFAVGTPEAIEAVFYSLETKGALDENFSTNNVFIVDKERNIRGRTDDEDYGTLYGYNASNYAEINNKMSDDLKVVLAEYRLALKKYKTEREI
ncbi:MAG: hypothetical protein CMC70_11555 [Flavobacteriaceae bacterium]|nr:hypothetical protein [Flavobacteriaceae bacterium]|tara:strand:+ start:556 stop:1200 length:645 start_codon:yes stop_codon:yes gene_type:complete